MPVLEWRAGTKLSYTEAGTGRPVVLVHGSPGEGRSWSKVVRQLPAGLRVLMPDLPGYGASDPLSQTDSARTAAMGEAISQLVRSCGEPVTLCGHSYGGNVALHAALTQPSQVETLVLLEPVAMQTLPLGGRHDLYQEAQSFFMGYVRRIDSREPDAVGAMIDFWFGEGAYDRLPAQVRGYLNGAAPKNADDVRASFAETLTAEQLAAFGRPVQIAIGGASPPLAPGIAAALADLLPRASVVAMPGATHGMLDGHPAAVAQLIGIAP